MLSAKKRRYSHQLLRKCPKPGKKERKKKSVLLCIPNGMIASISMLTNILTF